MVRRLSFASFNCISVIVELAIHDEPLIFENITVSNPVDEYSVTFKAVLLVNANVLEPLLSTSYVPCSDMYTLLAVPISYVFEPYLSVEVDPDSKPLNVSLLFPSKLSFGVVHK